jgi:uracil-DNA glycosylase
MLLACEIVSDLTYSSALAHSRPAAASLPKADFPELAEFARYHIAFVQPKVVVLFGSAACEALLGQELMSARGILHYINYNGQKTAAIATFHPRTLIAQPQLKAQAWKDLQMLVRKEYL